MINFLFKYYLNKKNFHKIFSSDLTQSQLEEIYHCYDNSNNKVNDKKKLIEDHIENELFQKLVYDDPELDINYKIKVLKDCNNNPFLKMSSNEIRVQN